MKKEQQIETLTQLEAALKQLGKQTLPIQTRSAIHAAQNDLKQLKQSLDKGSELEQGRLAALYQVSQSLGVSLNLDEVLTQVMDAVIQLTGAERGFLNLSDADTGSLTLRAARNFQQENLQDEDMKISRTVVKSVIESGKGIVTTDAQDDPRFAAQESVILHSLRAIMCAPLRASGNIIGAIYVDNRAQSGMFTNEDLDLLNAFAGQAAVAIENAQLYTRTDQALAERVSELETLSSIDQELNAQLDLERVLEITRLRAIHGTIGAEGWLALCTEEDETVLNFVAGPEEGLEKLPPEKLLAILQADTAPRYIPARENAPALLLAPLVHSGKISGAIVVSHPNGFSKAAQNFLERLAGRAAAAVENARLYEAVDSANEQKSQFVSIVTHELRIPLTSIKGYADLIRQGIVGEVTDQQAEFLDVIANNVERMSDLISDLSDISRIERGRIKLEMEQVQLQGNIKETLDSLKHKLEEKSQSLTTDIPTETLHVYADSSRVVQVLTNLISNAWKYTPEGGEITVKAYEKEERVCVEVIDTGFGISEEDQSKLFTQFFRSDSPSVREQNGWGLGLNVTRRLVELMGGEIGFHSKLDEGSTFWFILPSKPVEE
jgi:signal transduction histidine kinase